MRTNREQLNDVCTDCCDHLRITDVVCSKCPVFKLIDKLNIHSLFSKIIVNKDIPEDTIVFIGHKI